MEEIKLFESFEEFQEELKAFPPEVGMVVAVAYSKADDLPMIGDTTIFNQDSNHPIYFIEHKIEEINTNTSHFKIPLKDGQSYWIPFSEQKIAKRNLWSHYPRVVTKIPRKKLEILYTKEISLYASQSLPDKVITDANEEVASILRRTLREWPCDYDLAMRTKIDYGEETNIMTLEWYWKMKKEFHPKVI